MNDDTTENCSISYGKLIDKYGYECQWDLSKLKSIAYRLQKIKYMLVPQFIKKLVSAYFCGVLRFSASIIWLRSSTAHKNSVRYFYSMALAASLGLTAAEALNLACCKNMSVTQENSYYRRLIYETGLPSIEEMACLDAVSVTKQVSLLRPEWFTHGTLRQQTTARIRGEPGKLTAVKSFLKVTLVHSIFELRSKYTLEFLPDRKQVENSKNKIRSSYKTLLEKVTLNKKTYTKKYKQELYLNRKKELAMVDTPCLEYYFEALPFCSKGNVINYAHLIRAYTLRSRLSFDCLDTESRVKYFKTPVRCTNERTVRVARHF